MTLIEQMPTGHVRLVKGQVTYVFGVYNTPELGGKPYVVNNKTFYVDGIVPESVILTALYSFFI